MTSSARNGHRSGSTGESGRPAFRLSRSFRLSLTLFVLLILLSAAHSLWTIHEMQRAFEARDVAARLDHHFTLMVDQAEHYVSVAPRNYPDFFRDVRLYFTSLKNDIDTGEALVQELARRHAPFDASLWHEFRSGLEQQIGDDPERPRLEWAAEFIAGESDPLVQAIGGARAGLEQAADRSRHLLWLVSLLLAAATLALALVTAWLFRKRVLARISETSRAVRRMADGRFSGRRSMQADDELGRLETDVSHLARRTRELIELLNALNGANSLQEAVQRLPRRLQAQFGVAWLGLLEVHEGHVRLRASHPEVDRVGLEALTTGFGQSRTLFAEARKTARARFARLDEHPGSSAVSADPLLRQLGRAGMASVALLPVRDRASIDAVFVLASRDPMAFEGWRGRWLSNVGSLIAAALYKSIHVERLGISMIRGLAELAEKRDLTTGRHLERMQRYAGLIAAELVERGKVDRVRDPDYAASIETLAPLHDIGKVGISDSILLKPGRLTDEQTREMRRHPHIGADVLMALGEYLGKPGERVLAHATDIALYHHEKFDGSGYPYGLKRDAIPLSARIVAVADVFDALTSKRPYKRAWTEAEALELLERERGKHFDPEVLDAFHARMDQIRRVYVRYQDPELVEAAAGTAPVG